MLLLALDIENSAMEDDPLVEAEALPVELDLIVELEEFWRLEGHQQKYWAGKGSK